MVYKWRTLDYKVSAQDAGEHIEELDKQYGGVTTQILVDDARPTEALMHPLYEWDDSKAAEKFRNHQARTILSNLVVVKVQHEEVKEPTKVRAFVSVTPGKNTGNYRPLQIAVSNEDTREIVLNNARAELRAFTAKYNGLVDVIELLKEIISEMENPSA